MNNTEKNRQKLDGFLKNDDVETEEDFQLLLLYFAYYLSLSEYDMALLFGHGIYTIQQWLAGRETPSRQVREAVLRDIRRRLEDYDKIVENLQKDIQEGIDSGALKSFSTEEFLDEARLKYLKSLDGEEE